MTRIALLLCLTTALSVPAFSQHGTLDPAFQKIPFDKWLAEREQNGFRWKASVPPAELSFHQRLVSHIELSLDGKYLAPRRGRGVLVIFVQITDPGGAVYQDHRGIDFAKLDENIKAANLNYSQSVFIIPGDYQLSVVILDSANGEHAARQEKFHVAALKTDSIADSWKGLPPVEFIPEEEQPDSWFHPTVTMRPEWAATVKTPLRIDVIMNIPASTPSPGLRRTPSSTMGALISTLKVMSNPGSSSVQVNYQLLDLSRRKVVFRQKDVHELAWDRVKESLSGANPGTIDVKSLENRHHDAQFFVTQVNRTLRAAEEPPTPACAVVVVTNAISFESGEDLQPISPETKPKCRLVYIRVHPARPVHAFVPEIERRRGRGGRGAGPMRPNMPSGSALIDELAPTLKPLNPKLFDVETPEQMRKALAEIAAL